MATIAHLILPLLAWLRFRPGWQALALAAFFAVLPDIDILVSFLVNGDFFSLHRGPTHSLAFACIPVLFYAATRRPEFLWALGGALSHPLLDALDAHGAPLLWPFSNAMYSAALWHSANVQDLTPAGLLAPDSFFGDKLFATLLIVSLAYLSTRWYLDSLKRRH